VGILFLRSLDYRFGFFGILSLFAHMHGSVFISVHQWFDVSVSSSANIHIQQRVVFSAVFEMGLQQQPPVSK